MEAKRRGQCTSKIKALADIRPIAIDDADSIIRTVRLFCATPLKSRNIRLIQPQFHQNLYLKEEKPLLRNLTAEQQLRLEELDAELGDEKEKSELDKVVERETEGSPPVVSVN